MIMRLNRKTIDSFQEAANGVLDASKEVQDSINELESICRRLRSLIAACQSQKNNLINDINALQKTIKLLKEELRELKELLEQTPPTIPTKLGPMPNPAYISLKNRIAATKSRIAYCSSLMSQANEMISQLEDFIEKAQQAIDFIEMNIARLEEMSFKSIKNSEEVVAKMTRIKRVITRYLDISFSFASVSDIKSLISAEPTKFGRIINKTKGDNVQVYCRREDLAGMNHPTTGIPYERYVIKYGDGVTREIVAPKFPTDFTATLPKEMYTAKERIKGGQFEECTRQLKEKINSDWRLKKKFSEEQLDQIDHLITPRGYTWHHEPEEGKISLVLTSIHAQTGHTGGRNLWGGGSKMR